MPIESRPITSRAEWLEWRKQDVTASDVAAACGLSPWKSALGLWAEKAGLVPDQGETNLMRRGRWLEPAVLAAIRERHPHWKVFPAGVYVRDPEIRLGATPDAIVEFPERSPGIIQCKVVARPVFETWEGEVPLAYQLQTLTEAMLMGAFEAYLAALVIDTYEADLQVFKIDRNEAAEEAIVRAVKAFWDDVKQGLQPKVDYQVDHDVVRTLRPPKKQIEALDLASDNRLAELCHRMDALKALHKERQGEMDAIHTEIVDKLHGAPLAFTQEHKLKYYIRKWGEYTVAAGQAATLLITRRKP